jgi:UDP-glucose 4-epimerase
VESVVRLAQAPAAVGEVVNIGNDQEVTINELASLVKEITGSPSPIEHVSYNQAYSHDFEDMPRRVPCLEKLESLIQYRPATPLDTIVRRVVDYEWVRMPKRALAVAV